MTLTRDLYSSSELRPLLAPGSAVIIDYSSRPSSFGLRTLANLAGSGVRTYLVNPKQPQILDQPVFASLAELPERPDCAVIAVPRDAVNTVAAECARLGIKGAIVYASGYAETGRPEHRALQDELRRIGQASGMRIVGPNCMGIVSAGGRLRLSFSEVPDLQAEGRPAIGLVSQSGGLGWALAQSCHHGAAISHVLTVGNSCDVDVADQIAYLADQPECRVIACVFEGMAEPRRLMRAGELARRANKPVIVFKLATGREGGAAAQSHTGSLAGAPEVWHAAFEQAGFIEVDDFEALIETASFFVKAGRPSAEGVAALAASGGAAIMVADKAEVHGVPLPQPEARVTEILLKHIPEFGSARNPCDVTAQVLANQESLLSCARALLSSERFGALVVPHPYAYEAGTQRWEGLATIAREYAKPICCVWLSQWLDGPGALSIETHQHVALFRSMDRCLRTLKAWHLHERRSVAGSAEPARVSDAGSAGKVRALLADAPDKLLTESAAKRVLAAYGVPVTPDRLVNSADAAVEAAREFGYPVVLKVESPDIAHKTEAGGVMLDLQDDAAVRNAFDAVRHNVARRAPNARIAGLLVQPMIRRELELIVGAKRDPQFGPVVLVGLGGVLVEALKDVAVALAPVSRARALGMLDSLRGKALLDGFRGTPAVDRTALAEVICRISELAADHVSLIDELDVNPLVATGGRLIAVDALISRAA